MVRKIYLAPLYPLQGKLMAAPIPCRHAQERQAGHGEADLPAGQGIRRGGSVHHFEPEADSKGRIRYDEQGHSCIWSHLGLLIPSPLVWIASLSYHKHSLLSGFFRNI